jgi:uncharacterized protein (TIRG00374 family)
VRKIVQVSISIALMLLLLFITYLQVPDWQHAWTVMVEANASFLVLACGSVVLHMLMRALRWGVLLSPAKQPISLRVLFSMTVLKYVVNLIPPRAGEIAGSVLLARKERLAAAQVIATSVLERILDLMTLILVAAGYFLLFGQHHIPRSEQGAKILHALNDYSVKAFAISGIVLVALWILLRKRRWNFESTGIHRLLCQFLEGFRALHQAGTLVRAVLLSLAVWTAIALQTWFTMRAYLDNFPYSGSLLLMTITAIGVAIPTPGGIGGFHYFTSQGLIHFFVEYMSPLDPYSQAAGISNGAYVVRMLPLFIIVIIVMTKEGLFFETLMATDKTRRPLCDSGNDRRM